MLASTVSTQRGLFSISSKKPPQESESPEGVYESRLFKEGIYRMAGAGMMFQVTPSPPFQFSREVLGLLQFSGEFLRRRLDSL